MKEVAFSITNPISNTEVLKLEPMTLAFIGDAVQSLYTRSIVSIGSTCKTGTLHKEVTNVVKATSQAKVLDLIYEEFNDIEKDLFRRTRNCKIQTSAKHAEMSEYRKASGFEAVIGYLYLTGQNSRLEKFLDKAYEENKC